jgi:MYXO-CTERM domain-containing protein
MRLVRRFRLVACGLALAVFASQRAARATYSIVAADTGTAEIGGAGTSCLKGSDVYMIYGSVPGVGVVHTQATYEGSVHARSIELVAQGLSPLDVIRALTDETRDSDAQKRQFAVVNVRGEVAGFTGSAARAFAGDRAGSVGAFRYSAQGNILTSAAVLAQAAQAFEAPGCDLAARLMRALEAGADNGEGDNRCTASRGIPSDSAFVQVDRPDQPAGSYLELRVPSSGDENPLPLLRAAFDSWRQAHPCPAAGTGGGAGSEPVPDLQPASRSGCNCRLSSDSAESGAAGAGVLVALLLARFRRWNRRRFQC